MIFTITRCDNLCEANKLAKKAQEQKTIFDMKTDEAWALINQLSWLLEEATQAKLLQREYQKWATELYSWIALTIPVWVAYAGWDEPTKKIARDDIKETTHSDRDIILMDRICTTAWGRSPMCNNWSMYYSGKQIFEDAGVPRGIALWIMNAESNIWVNYAWTCDYSWNNWGGIKYRKNSDGSVTKDQAIPNNWCRLYKFDTIDDYFRSKANTLGIWYKACFDGRSQPIRCISYAYVGSPNVAEQSWINNVSKIAE